MLKKVFNDYLIKNYNNIQSLGEVDLLKALIEVMGQTDYSYAIMEHGKSGMVKHNLNYPHSAPDSRECEIADILMLFFDGDHNLRYTFLQNKRDKKTKYDPQTPLTKIKADPVQWDLLHYKSPLTSALNTKLPIDCLSSAILNSVATYGIFVNDLTGPTVDMSYSIARDLVAAHYNPIPKKPHDRIYNVSSDYGKIKKENGYYEIQGTRTLDEFELAAKAMMIGSPIEFNNPKQRELARLLLSFALTCLKNDQSQIERTQDYINIINNFVESNHIEINSRNDILLPLNLIIMESKKICYYACANDEERIEFIKTQYGENAIIPESFDDLSQKFLQSDYKDNFIFITDLCEKNDLKGKFELKWLEALCKIFKDVSLFGLLAKDEFGIKLIHPEIYAAHKP